MTFPFILSTTNLPCIMHHLVSRPLVCVTIMCYMFSELYLRSVCIRRPLLLSLLFCPTPSSCFSLGILRQFVLLLNFCGRFWSSVLNSAHEGMVWEKKFIPDLYDLCKEARSCCCGCAAPLCWHFL